MPIAPAFLIAAEAGGMIMDFFGKQKQIKASKQAAKLEQDQIDQQIQLSRVQYEEESLASLKELRQNLGTQMAYAASRGIGGQSAGLVIGGQESISNQGADQRVRKMNQLYQEAALKTNKRLSELHQKTYEAGVWNQFKESVFNKIPTSPKAWEEWGNVFSKQNTNMNRPRG